MTPHHPTIEAARAELGHLLAVRAQRSRRARTATSLAGGTLLLVWLVVAPPRTSLALAIGLFGGLVFIIWGLLAAFGVIPITGHQSRYQHDRITYLQACVAAHDAAARPVRARGSQPKPRAPLPSTIESREPRPPTAPTVELRQTVESRVEPLPPGSPPMADRHRL